MINAVASTIFNGIFVSAAITSGASSQINGNIRAVAAISLGASTKVVGNLNAGAAITLGANSIVTELAQSSIGVITYGDGAVVQNGFANLVSPTSCSRYYKCYCKYSIQWRYLFITSGVITT
jgi:predicted acyltransferase (DUF342 family)